MSACLMIGGVMAMLASPEFTLTWSHSVEHTAWREHWRIEDGALKLTGAAVKGSGAGMEPGAGARLRDGWWVWTPSLPPVPELLLAASGATGGGWTLCAATACRDLGVTPGEAIRLVPCVDQP